MVRRMVTEVTCPTLAQPTAAPLAPVGEGAPVEPGEADPPDEAEAPEAPGPAPADEAATDPHPASATLNSPAHSTPADPVPRAWR
jgi:hypothetical protein